MPKNSPLHITFHYMKTCNILQCIIITITITPGLSVSVEYTEV